MRGQGEMFWIIVTAALALIVLVILAAILWKGSGGFIAETGCTIRGGECVPLGRCPQGEASLIFSCAEKEEVCCLSKLV